MLIVKWLSSSLSMGHSSLTCLVRTKEERGLLEFVYLRTGVVFFKDMLTCKGGSNFYRSCSYELCGWLTIFQFFNAVIL